MTDPRELSLRSQQYRNYDPEEFREEFRKSLSDQEELELERALQSVFPTIESARFGPFLDNVFQFFSKLDRDEQVAFTHRNPDVVQWMSAWAEAQNRNPYDDFWQMAERLLTGTHTRTRVGMPEKTFQRMPGPEMDPPPFTRDPLEGRELLKDMMHRRRSYRNWAPPEFKDIVEMGKIEVSRGEARELGLRTPEIRQEMEFPRQIDGDEVARALFHRVEGGRFEPVLNTGTTFFYPLDPDERTLFAQRNPGIIMWFDAFGAANHTIHGPDLVPGSTVDWPTLPTFEKDEGARINP